MTARDVVAGYLAALGMALRALMQSTTGVDRSGGGLPLEVTTLAGARVRRGQIDGVGAFRLHGAGCAFELDSGEDVDFDWDTDGRPIFDLWRLRNYGRSIGEDEVTDADLADALESLVRAGVLAEAGDGWFRLA